jgi:hypothetical protein
LSSYKVAAGNDLQRIFPWKQEPEIDLGYGLGTGQWAKTAKRRMQEKMERCKVIFFLKKNNSQTPLVRADGEEQILKS